MDISTKRLVEFARDKGVSILNLSKKTGIPYGKVYSCFSGKRSLRADEFLSVCKFLEKSPLDFSPEGRRGEDSVDQKGA